MNTRGNRKAISWAVFIFFVVIPYVEMSGAEKAVAWIVEGYTGCKITRYEKGKFIESDAAQDMPLFPGDKIERIDNIKSVRIECLPYVTAQIEEPTRLTIVTIAPEHKETIFTKFLDWLGLVKIKYKELRGTSRGSLGFEAVSMENATLLANQTIVLDKYYKGKTLVFKQLDGKEVFSKTFTIDLELNPKNAGLIPGKMYIREVKKGETLEFRSTIRVLDKGDEETVNRDLTRIDREKISVAEKIIKKAAYLQFISDLYPGHVDLYWYSYQLLQKADIKEEGLLDLYEILIGSCLEHKSGGISGVDFALLDNKPGCLVTVDFARNNKTDFVSQDYPFNDDDVFSLCFQVNFTGYCAVLHDSGAQTSLAFPVDHTGHQVKPVTEYRSCQYRFDDKPGTEYHIFILSDEPLKEIEQYGPHPGGPASPWPCVEPNTRQRRLLQALIRRVKEKGQEIILEMMGSKSLARIPGTHIKGITWFRVALKN